jgi:hypothetical protein
MKMTMKNLFALAVLLLFSSTLTSCSSDDDGEQLKPDPVKERMSLLTNNASKSWLFTAQTEEGENVASQCQLDDVWTFKSDGTLEIDIKEECYEGQGNGDIDIIEWSFNANASAIIAKEMEGFEILELTDNKLILEFEYEGNNEGQFVKSQVSFKAM